MYKILIVDDEAIERRCISFILENSKYSLEIEEAETDKKHMKGCRKKSLTFFFQM